MSKIHFFSNLKFAVADFKANIIKCPQHEFHQLIALDLIDNKSLNFTNIIYKRTIVLQTYRKHSFRLFHFISGVYKVPYSSREEYQVYGKTIKWGRISVGKSGKEEGRVLGNNIPSSSPFKIHLRNDGKLYTRLFHITEVIVF